MLGLWSEYQKVSIHAFRGEGDMHGGQGHTSGSCFNPRLPGGRRRSYCHRRSISSSRFQSTPSGGKATSFGRVPSRCLRCFNPRLPGGRRLIHNASTDRTSQFQSTPSGGKATAYPPSAAATIAFQSTPSGGKATCDFYVFFSSYDVSIHAFRGEGDSSAWVIL